jgi:class 3 adenylate cyclase
VDFDRLTRRSRINLMVAGRHGRTDGGRAFVSRLTRAITGNSLLKGGPSAPVTPRYIAAHSDEREPGCAVTAWTPFVIRYARRHLGFLAGLVIAAIAIGIIYRYLFDPLEEREPAYYLRSILHAVGLAISGWAVHLTLAAAPRTPLGGILRRLPQGGELAIKVVVMTTALTIAAVVLQLVLYPTPHFSQYWLTHHLPVIVIIAFAISLVAGALFEFQRLIGGRVLGSFLLGTYHRPRREQRIVMFLDIADSTALAEQMGEVRVHDLITRFFFDIDRPIADHDGEVHAYVGDQVIVTWPLSEDPERNARSLRCFFAAEERIAELTPAYRGEFGLTPRFRAGIHAGPVVISECGDAKRQIAYFGDTMNVAARLCEHAKFAGEGLLVSAEMLHGAAIPQGLSIGSPDSIGLRGRQTPVEAYTMHRRDIQLVQKSDANVGFPPN